MYNFIYIFFYRLSFKKNPDAKGAAKTFVALASFMHLFFFVSIVTFIFDIKISSLDDSSILNKLFFLPVLILWYFFIALFYNKKKINKLISENEDKKSVVSVKNILFILIIMVLPTIIAIKLILLAQS